MSDFAQSGLISTFQQLNPAHLPKLEEELCEMVRERPVALILPCHGSDLERPALRHIIEELGHASFCSEIIVSVNGVDAAGIARVTDLFAPLPQPVRILWNDAPDAQPLLARFEPGKGLNVWTALGLLSIEQRVEIIAMQDCDVASFQRGTLARLCYACAQPRLGYSFAKMFYSRATDRLYGRVSRLFFAPLLYAIMRLAGHRPLIDFLLSFRYPLAGECAMTLEVATQLPMRGGWALETGLLCQLFRHVDPRQVCQVDGGSGYDHKHQCAISALAAMSAEIASTLLAELAAEGLNLDTAWKQALPPAYRREAAQALRRSAHLALINGLPFDEAGEQLIVDTFAAQLETLQPSAFSPLPAWEELFRAEPDFLPQLRNALLGL